jgi:hypothetical protein
MGDNIKRDLERSDVMVCATLRRLRLRCTGTFLRTVVYVRVL